MCRECGGSHALFSAFVDVCVCYYKKRGQYIYISVYIALAALICKRAWEMDFNPGICRSQHTEPCWGGRRGAWTLCGPPALSATSTHSKPIEQLLLLFEGRAFESDGFLVTEPPTESVWVGSLLFPPAVVRIFRGLDPPGLLIGSSSLLPGMFLPEPLLIFFPFYPPNHGVSTSHP